VRHLYIPITLFLLLVVEGVNGQLLASFLLDSDTQLVPHWLFIFLILIAIFYDRETTYFSVVYSVIFGLFIDIVYTDILGVYMFVYGIVTYIVHTLKKHFRENFTVTILLGVIGIILVELAINTIYLFIGVAQFEWSHYFYFRLLPTVLANMIFLIICYPFFKNRLLSWKQGDLVDR